jgi:hypothetical protein
MKHLISPILKWATLSVLLIPISTALAQEPLWKTEFDKNAQWFYPTSTGVMLVATSGGLHGLDPESQQVVWTLEEFSGWPMENFRVVPNTLFFEILGLPSVKKEKKEGYGIGYRGPGKPGRSCQCWGCG